MTILALVALLAASSPGMAQEASESAPEEIAEAYPVEEWRDAGEAEGIRWDFRVGRFELRMDQRIEVAYTGRIRSEDLEPRDVEHDLFLKSWVRSRETGDWLAESAPVEYSVEAEIPNNVDIEFNMTLFVTPGDFDLVVLLVDRTTGRHSLGIERMEIDNPDDDWFPNAYAHVPVVEFPDTNWLSDPIETEGTGNLVMPLVTERPLDVEVIAMLSTPEQHMERGSIDGHRDNMQDTLVALSQLDIANGTLSVIGLDLVQRRQVFEQTGIEELDVEALDEALDEANQHAISLDDLLARTENPAFLREFVESRVSPYIGPPDPETSLKVFVFISGITRFDDDADIRQLRLDGECACVAFHIRIRLFLRDLFDQIEEIIDPLDPETYSINNPSDLRGALGRMVRELEEY
jgi:hypothetical protein